MARMVEVVDAVPSIVDASDQFRLATWSKLLGLVVLFLGAFLAVTFGIRSALPPYLESSHIRQSYRHFERYGERYDTVFFGSSRAQFQIDPKTFDQALAKRGITSKSFNFGISALNGLELEFVLNQVLDLSGAQLRRVIIDLGDVRWRLKADHARTEQVIARHDTITTWRLLQLIDSLAEQGPAQQEARKRHRKAWFDHITSEGRGAYWLTNWVLKPAPEALPPEAYTGFEALDRRLGDGDDEGDTGAVKVHEKFLRHVPDFEKRVRDFARQVKKFEARRARAGLTAPERALVERVIASIRKAGAEPIFYIAPRLNFEAHYMLLAEDAGLIEHVLNYSDPERFKVLYDPKKHFDDSHFNRAGAVAFSKQLANDVAELESADRKAELAP